jgi:hypothetical protein
MEKPHHRRHRKLDPTDRRKTSYENGAKRRINNTVPKQFEPLTSPNSPVALLSIAKQIPGPSNQMPEWWHFPLYEPAYVWASNHLGTSVSVQVKTLDWIGQETGEVTYTSLQLSGWNGNGWRTHLTQLPTPFRPQKEDD